MTTTTTTRQAPLPGTLRLGLARGGVELRQFFRDPAQVVFTFSLPALLVVLLGSVFSEEFEGTGITASQLFAASMIAAGIMSTSLVNVGSGVAQDREDGTLKRLHGTPLTAASYFLGKIVLVAVAATAEVVIMLVVAVLLFDLPLPSSPGDWFTLAWVFALGLICCTLLGIALSALASSANAAVAIMQLPYLALGFISGIFFTPITQLPGVLVDIASVFPLKWMAQGLRSVFLPDGAQVLEVAGSWELGRVALVLGAWCVAGLLLCLLTFRWSPRRGG